MGPLKIALGNYGLTRPLKERKVKPGKFELEFIEVEPITAGMRRMVRNLEFDICEMAWTTYLCAKDVGKPITAIPVFLTRNFHHWAIFVNANAGIKTPKDLEGRRVGVNRGYTVTTGVWARGILASEYGIDLDKITWACSDDEHVSEFQPPKNVEYSLMGKSVKDLLAKGELDAAVGDLGADLPSTVKPLIPDAQGAGFAYHKKTGVYPVNHGVVIQDRLLKEQPQVASEMFAAFKAAKQAYYAKLDSGEGLDKADNQALALKKGVGGEPFPFGVAENRKALETIVRFARDQRAISKSFTVDELSARELTDV
jgi:4,5-dihydroxyphthalate decarboxylase